MQGNLHVRFGVDLLISNAIGKLGHYYLWEQYSLYLVDFIIGFCDLRRVIKLVRRRPYRR